jgi:transcriptional regulator with XRE-family HTH domain
MGLAAYHLTVCPMPRSSRSPRQARLQELLVVGRTAAGLSQEEVARRLRRPQSFVSKYESGERRLDVVELIEIAEAIGFDACKLVADLASLGQP